MARYIDADKLEDWVNAFHLADAYWAIPMLRNAPTADVVERSECEKWYHEYHGIKDALKQEKEYHRSTEKLADKYQAELEAMRGAANSYKMHYENAKTEVAREILTELESELADVNCIDREFDVYLNLTIEQLRKKYGICGQSRTPVPTGENGGEEDE